MFDDALPDPVVLKYYLYNAVGRPGFIAPIYVLYLLLNGLSYAEIGAIGAIQTTLVVAGEVPTGYVGDRIGRRNSLLVAQVLYTASAVGMLLAHDFLGFAVSFALLSIGMTFVSGSADAWLYDILQERLDEDTYTHVRGRGSAVGQWVGAATMIAGGVLYVVEPVYPFVAVLGTRLLTFLVLGSMPQNAQYADREASRAGGDAADDDAEQTDDDRFTVVDALPLIREQLARPPLRSFVTYVALFVGAVLTAGVYIQPMARSALEATLGARLAAFGVAEPASIGALYASFTVVSAIASDHASDLEAWLGVRRALYLVPAATAVLLLAPAVAPALAFPMFFAIKGSRSVLQPIVGQYLNDHVASAGRATILSAVSMVYAGVRIPLTLGSGVLATATSPTTAVAAVGLLFVVAGGSLAVLTDPVAGDPADGPGGAPDAAEPTVAE